MKDKTPTIIATTALVVAVFASTPVGQAAGKLVLGKNSVGAAQLKKNAVTGKKIANNAVTGAKVKDESVTGADVLESSLGKVPSATSADHAASADRATAADTLAAPEAWHEVGGVVGNPSFQNGWLNYSTGGCCTTAGYYKDRFGFVHLKGMISGGLIFSAAFTLPAGYRPAHPQHMPATSSNTSGTAQVVISSDGRVVPGPGDNAWLTLDGIVFPAP